MDNSTLSFFAALAVLFVVIKYFTSPSQEPPASRTRKSAKTGTTAAGDTTASSSSVNTSSQPNATQKTHRQVTKDMVEIVQQIGPQLTEEQIVYDLSKTGSIEETINKFLSEGNLPEAPKSKKKKNWPTSEEERSSLLAQKKQDMIMKARMRLRAQLTNEIDFN